MSLATLIQQQAVNQKEKRCRTCQVWDLLTAEDHEDFHAAAENKVPGAQIARAVTARLAELGFPEKSVSQGSVRFHLNEHKA